MLGLMMDSHHLDNSIVVGTVDTVVVGTDIVGIGESVNIRVGNMVRLILMAIERRVERVGIQIVVIGVESIA